MFCSTLVLALACQGQPAIPSAPGEATTSAAAREFLSKLAGARAVACKATGSWIVPDVHAPGADLNWRVDALLWFARSGQFHASTTWTSADAPAQVGTVLHVESDGITVRSWFEGDEQGRSQPAPAVPWVPFPWPYWWATSESRDIAHDQTPFEVTDFPGRGTPPEQTVALWTQSPPGTASSTANTTWTWLAFERDTSMLKASCSLTWFPHGVEVLLLDYTQLQFLDEMPKDLPRPPAPGTFLPRPR